jgi:hypothetical protein
LSGLLCYTSRVKSYAEPVQIRQFGWAGFAAIAIHFVPVAATAVHSSAGLSAPVFEGRDFEEEKSLV